MLRTLLTGGEERRFNGEAFFRRWVVTRQQKSKGIGKRQAAMRELPGAVRSSSFGGLYGASVPQWCCIVCGSNCIHPKPTRQKAERQASRAGERPEAKRGARPKKNKK